MSMNGARFLDSPRMGRITGALLTAFAVAGLLLRRLTYGDRILTFFADDFFYYAQIAKNIAYRGQSTWDGSTLTNGYHPLWAALLVLFWKIHSGRYFFLLVILTISVASFVVFFSTYELCRRYRVHNLLALVISLWSVGCFMVVAGGGMEPVLAVPLGLLAFLYLLSGDFRWSSLECAIFGVLMSVTILARIDAIVLFVLLLTILVAFGKVSSALWTKRLAFMSIGCIPLIVYLTLNKYIFGQPTPISGTAKSLKAGFHWDPVAFIWTFGAIARWSFPRSYLLGIAVVLIVFGMIGLGSRRVRTLPDLERAVLCAGVLFPFVHMAILSIVGDWQIFFLWYYYTLIFGTVCGAILCYTAIRFPERPAIHPLVEFTLGAMVLIAAIFVRTLRPASFINTPSYPAAIAIADFAKSHPGRYAMGDRSGLVGFLLGEVGDSMVQTEGLVMDRSFLNRIRNRTDLFSTLRAYEVDYYIATELEQDGPCYQLTEPYFAGPRSPKMHSTVCETPDTSIKITRNRIFLVSKSAAASRLRLP